MKSSQDIPVARTAVDEADSAIRCCDHPSCAAEGAFRAPKSRSELKAFYFFCLEHIRAYNAAWDYFSGMSQADIERFQHDAATWHRPTWRFGEQEIWSALFDGDVFGLFGDGAAANAGAGAKRTADGKEQRSLAMLNLDASTTLQEIKMRYKQLVKQHHPDANGGDKRAEERFKSINEAYSYLRACGYS